MFVGPRLGQAAVAGESVLVAGFGVLQEIQVVLDAPQTVDRHSDFGQVHMGLDLGKMAALNEGFLVAGFGILQAIQTALDAAQIVKCHGYVG